MLISSETGIANPIFIVPVEAVPVPFGAGSVPFDAHPAIVIISKEQQITANTRFIVVHSPLFLFLNSLDLGTIHDPEGLRDNPCPTEVFPRESR
ncbi:hypothetical protein SDC9_90615 [bioreactor metagenome]|uniref:Uncharacterized protein n=1 Tax=bioreactor metagenome TaxID=1076179 RepID=A0A644ZT54_9ZZZZ